MSNEKSTPLLPPKEVKKPPSLKATAAHRFLGQCYSTLYPSAMHDAIKTGDDKKVKWLLDIGVDLNKNYEDSIPPLKISLLENKPAITLLLLEHGANVNADYNFSKVGGSHCKILQGEIDKNDESHVRLLALHGASTQGISFAKNPHLQTTYQDAYKDFEKNQQLKERLSSSSDAVEQANIATQLAALWSKIAQHEKQPHHKKYYESKSNNYAAQARVLSNEYSRRD